MARLARGIVWRRYVAVCPRSLVVIGQNNDSGDPVETRATDASTVAGRTTSGDTTVAEFRVSGKRSRGAVDLGESGWHGLMAQLASLG